MTKEVPISQGHVVLIDDEDYERVMAAGKWQADSNGLTTYAHRAFRIDGRRRSMFLHTFLTGWPLVDHRNRNGLDNRRANLRPATYGENARNAGRPSTNTSGYKGVSLNKEAGRYVAYIYFENKRHHLGYFSSAEEAARVRDAAALELHGEFAWLNFKELTS